MGSRQWYFVYFICSVYNSLFGISPPLNFSENNCYRCGNPVNMKNKISATDPISAVGRRIYFLLLSLYILFYFLVDKITEMFFFYFLLFCGRHWYAVVYIVWLGMPSGLHCYFCQFGKGYNPQHWSVVRLYRLIQ